MGRHHFSLKCVLEIGLFSTIFLNVTAASYEQPGFLSIDCGSTEDRYTDDIGLIWVNDRTNISTGKISGRVFNLTDSYLDNSRALEDFRYFPENRSKHCYDLHTTSNISYLIRAMFYYDPYESNLLQPPIKFNVFINSTKWFTVDDEYSGYIIETHEGIFYSPRSIIYFCLQPDIGIPFISSLELRPLDPDGIMYSSTGSKRKYLSLSHRLNYGTGNASKSVRFPDDPFDRLWTPVWTSSDYPEYNDYESLGYDVNAPPGLNVNTNAYMNNVPTKVMLDAMEFPYPTNITLESSTDLPLDNIYVALYFQELNGSDSARCVIGINDRKKDIYTTSSFIITSNVSMQVIPDLNLGTKAMGISFYPANSSFNDSDPPTMSINALEMYTTNTFEDSSIDVSEGKAIVALQRSFNLNDWQGDPCTPVPNYWLTCSFFDSDWSVDTITLSNLSNSGWRLLIDKYYLDQYSSLYLIEMSLTYSQIDNATLQFLIGNFTRPSSASQSFLNKLDFSYNLISAIPPAIYWENINVLTSLNLSHNVLDGQLSSFAEMPFIEWLEVLNLTYNTITSLPTEWARSNATTNLVVLDVSHNKLDGAISSLNKLVTQNWETLREIYVSNNNLTEIFPSDLYFSNLTSLSIAKFDENLIEGTLDLTSWHISLQQFNNVSSFEASSTGQLFSFVNNKIQDINPKAEDLEVTITFLLQNSTFNKTGILLGGNPYCKNQKSKIHRYLCRSTIEDKYIMQEENNNKLILIIGIIGGVFLLLVCSVLLATKWNLWRKVSTLRQIQQALAYQKVKPPFYSYNDLKFATRDFHKDNKLGNGAFGVVYKGVLADGTTLAVKKLFNSQQVQVLNEFLNEVVLITGIKHKNLIQLKGCCITDKERILVYEYAEKGNLAEALWGKPTHEISILDWQQRLNICVGVARGLSYLHEELQQRIIHRDIKPANILLDKNLNPQIGDFGLAKHCMDEQSHAQFTNVAGTRGYFAPEYASQGKLTEKADVFSFGILVLEIVSGRKVIDPNLPPDRIYLKDWAQKLHRDGMSLDILQPELRHNCIEAEVIRVINIALICVQMHSEQRATMSQVVTMFLGNMDVTIFLDTSKYRPVDFNVIHPTYDGHSVTSMSTIDNNFKATIIEESDEIELPFLKSSIKSKLQPSNSDISTSGVANVELSDMTGR